MKHRYSIQVPIMCDVVVEAESSRDAMQQAALMKIEGLNPYDVINKGIIAEVDPLYHSRTGHQFINGQRDFAEVGGYFKCSTCLLVFTGKQGKVDGDQRQCPGCLRWMPTL